MKNKNPRGKNLLHKSVYWERYLNDSLKAQERLSERISKIRRILVLRHQHKMTLQAIGDEFNLSRERIRQILERFNVK